MSPAKLLLLVAAAVLLLSVFEVSGDEVIPSKCDPSCQQLPPPSPPFSGYPSYGAPPPLPPSGYSIYSTPPPPHKKGDQSKCPPAGAGVQCCTPPFPYTYAPPYPYTYAPPNPYTYAPPNPYTYVPYGEGGRLPLPIIATLVMIFSSFIFLF